MERRREEGCAFLPNAVPPVMSITTTGSLPTTHDSQGSDMGLFGGLMGWDAADDRLPGSMQTLEATGVRMPANRRAPTDWMP